MYELKLPSRNQEKFKKAVQHKLIDLDWTQQELANKLGRPVGSVRYFFSKGKWNRYLAAEIVTVLEMKNTDWR